MIQINITGFRGLVGLSIVAYNVAIGTVVVLVAATIWFLFRCYCLFFFLLYRKSTFNAEKVKNHLIMYTYRCRIQCWKVIAIVRTCMCSVCMSVIYEGMCVAYLSFVCMFCEYFPIIKLWIVYSQRSIDILIEQYTENWFCIFAYETFGKLSKWIFILR